MVAAVRKCLSDPQARICRFDAGKQAGFTTPNLLEAETNRAFIRGAAEVVVVADHTKFGVTGLSTICPLATANALIVDDELDPAAADLLRSEIPDVQLV
jgi:DeoR/GlpR family transcriptional regulator of sugar metabolism